MSYRIEDLLEDRKKLPQVGINPVSHPLGENGFHTEKPFLESDRKIGEVCGWYMGDIFSDIDHHSDFMYREMTSQDTWTRIARALRIHGLKIVDDPSFIKARDRNSWDHDYDDDSGPLMAPKHENGSEAESPSRSN